jgi:ATP-dependent protease ClpP protease subunit
MSVDNSLYFKIFQEHRPSLEDLNKKRRAVLAELQEMLDAPVISYMANISHPHSAMYQPDVDAMVNFIQYYSKKAERIYLIIESPGGDVNVAVKLVKILRAVFPKGFSVIVPSVAKSAATMLVLGADEIVVGSSSELGLIDPQIIVFTGNPQQPFAVISARFIVRFIENAKREISGNLNLVNVYYPLLQQLRPDLIEMAQEAIEMSKEYAKELLRQGLMKGASDDEINKVVDYLSGEGLPALHESPITYDKIKDLGMNVVYWDQDDPRWIKVLEYYFRVKAFFQINPNVTKIIETPNESMIQQVQIIQIPQQASQQPPPAASTKQ